MRPKILGLVFDMSLRHLNNKRILDSAKDSVLQFISTFDEEEDGLYIYHPLLTDILYRKGEQTCMLGNYETDGYRFDVGKALLQTLYVVGQQADPYVQKTVCLITDRMQANYVDNIKHVLAMNEKDDIGCEIMVIGIGNSYQQPVIQDTVFYIHLDTPLDINPVLTNWFDDDPADLDITVSDPEDN